MPLQPPPMALAVSNLALLPVRLAGDKAGLHQSTTYRQIASRKLSPSRNVRTPSVWVSAETDTYARSTGRYVLATGHSMWRPSSNAIKKPLKTGAFFKYWRKRWDSNPRKV